ncbi:MAG: gamma-glutamylcyclotransferase [Labrys sp. (in: a-proteobacteria)]
MIDPVADAPDDLWVFGYGSLMWRPGFDHDERRVAHLSGLHRSLCIYSHVHRGTPDRPGLVLGLDRGGACKGIAYRVPAKLRRETVQYLRAREQVTSVYVEIVIPVRLDDGRRVDAVAYRVDRRHGQYAGRLSVDRVVDLVLQGVGVSGANPDYVIATTEHLRLLGIHDRFLEAVMARLADRTTAPA